MSKQVIPGVFVKTPVAPVQAVQNMLLGRKSIWKHPVGSVYIVGSTSTPKSTPAVTQQLNQSGNITSFYRILTKNNQMFYKKNC